MSSRSWSPEAVELAGISMNQLPEILPTTATLGLAPEAARRIGVPAGTPVVAGAADGPLGNLGTRALEPGVAGLSLGTSGAIRMVVPEPQVDDAGTLFCYALTDSVWVAGGAVSNGGIVVRWAGRALAPDLQDPEPARMDEAVLALAASVPAGSEGLVMLPVPDGRAGPAVGSRPPRRLSGPAARPRAARTWSARRSRASACSCASSWTSSTGCTP